MDSPSSSAVDAPKKRVMPSRSRRGVCESDQLILDTFKRQYELLPLDTPFLLSTNSQVAQNTASNTEAGIHINIVASERYFARPEVLKAFREQEIIQTPEFESIGESSYVGTRTRPRPEDATIDTSDAAYEKRHRKFETLEKRLRIREKEKLKYEHHKLKERMTQLQGMDASAFMSIPSSYFSPPPPQTAAEPNESAFGGSYGQPNGTISEGERRRREMLETASKLEKRYAYLLPPERVRKNQDQASDSGSKFASEARDDDESESERIYQGGPSRRDDIMKFRIPARSSASTTPAPSPGGPKPAPAKKARAPGPPKQTPSSRLRRGSVSTTPSVAFLPDQDASTNDYNDVDMHDVDHIPTSTPGPDDEDVLPVSNTNGASKVVSAVGNGRLKNGKGKKMVRGDHERHVADEDGESEKVSSEDEAMEEPEAAHEPEPEPEPEPVVMTTPAKRGRKKKVKEPLLPAALPEALGDSESVRDLSSRLEQTTFKLGQTNQGLQNIGETTDDAAMPPTLPFEQTESISIISRPHKRRKGAAQESISSIRTPSAQPAEGSSVGPRKYHTTKGKSFVTYTDSITGEQITTTCSLLIAAVRKGRARHTYSFGVETPKFVENVEFELPEWLHFPESEPGSPHHAMQDLPVPEEQVVPPEGHAIPDQNDAKTDHPEGQTDDGQDAPMDQAHVGPDTTEDGVPTAPEGGPGQDSEDMDIDQSDAVEEGNTNKMDVTPQESNSNQEEGQKENLEPEVEAGSDPLPPAEDTESDSRVRPRILSRPADEEEEELLW